MVQKKTLLFVYDFPHSKSIDFIYTCVEKNIKIDVIVGSDYIKLQKPRRVFNFHKLNIASKHPKDVASEFNIPYFNCNHNGSEIEKIINEFEINFGIIAGSRILKKHIIERFSFGVLNFHPGILPYNRGLDAILWSIYNNNKLGVTAHLINEKIDSGKLVVKKIFKPLKADTIFEIYNKIYKIQLELLPVAFNLINNKENFGIINKGSYNTYMSLETQKNTLKKLKSYITNYSKIA